MLHDLQNKNKILQFSRNLFVFLRHIPNHVAQADGRTVQAANIFMLLSGKIPPFTDFGPSET